MATVIKRTSEVGDPRLARVPFALPGPKPIDRLSSLAFQGMDAEPAPWVANAEGTRPFTQGIADPVSYKILPSGVPVFDFDMREGNPNQTLYMNGLGRTVKTQIVVGRILQLGSSAQGNYAPLVRMLNNGFGALTVGQPGGSFGRKLMALGAASGSYILGPDVEVGANSGLHFFAAVWSGATSRLHYDGEVTTGTLTDPENPVMTLGYGLNGSHIQIVEASQYATALSAQQIEAIRDDYRGLFQF